MKWQGDLQAAAVHPAHAAVTRLLDMALMPHCLYVLCIPVLYGVRYDYEEMGLLCTSLCTASVFGQLNE